MGVNKGTVDVNNINGTVSLPTGAATESTLSSINTSVDQVESLITSSNTKLDTLITQTDTLETNTLNTANSTSSIDTKISTTNSSLASIDSKTPALVSGRQPVDGSGVTQPISAASLPLPTGAATSANQATTNASLSSIDSKTPALVAGRQPVDGSGVTQPVSAVSLPLPTGASTSALQTTANSSLSSIDTKVTGLALETTQQTTNTRIGDLTEAAPGTDTASSGLNGRLQRIAQRLTSLLTATTDRTQKTQITNGTIDVAASATVPSLADSGLIVRPLPFEPNTYGAGSSNIVIAALPTDIWQITGSATKTIRVTRLILSGTTTSGTPISVNMTLVKRSALNTGGTSTVAANIPYDSTSPAGTATVRHYTVNPTALGTSVGNVRANRLTFQNTGTNGGTLNIEFENSPVILRGANETLNVNLGGVTVTGAIVAIAVEWQEV
jgi:hypothetical protein